MKIRLGEKKDHEKVAQYVKGLWMMHAKEEPTFMNLQVFENADPVKYYESIDGKNSLLLIAEDNEELAGFVKIDIKEIERFFISKKVLYIDEIYVLQEFRNKGVSKMLMDEAERIAKKRKISLMKARVYEFNKAAQKAMSSQGYKALYSEYYKIIK